ncbi:AAA family ATPase [Aporhodopirellula aestuarii]|uniref:MoxR family ATPase n=1 Tax=Aporhodopirellula aestuarii TaxID=2950107 RepID=A0ABT0U757_9BACT|nr:MoxR family ATPase [Aporhodopirellula aestuarii]MCM2372769.1 MoxR family ATPase [Aporhodopirellula aestuarii]
MNDTSPKSDHPEIVQRLREAREQLKREIGRVVIGQDKVVDSLLIAMLCRGHALMIGVPGLGKTLIARSLAQMLDMEYRRIQFTPDLMPSDITGSDIIEEDTETGRRRLEFFRGPLFTNFLLADEINRAPPKTQAALLQAMQEREVSVGRETYHLPPPFFVVATQNPVEQEGTYPLPEAQLDRFMFNVPVVYPSKLEEIEIVKATTGDVNIELNSVLTRDDVRQLQHLVRGVPIANHVVEYAVDLVTASRPESKTGSMDQHRLIRYGASPRASQCLVLGGKARAVLLGRYHVDFEDIRAVASPVMRHRLALNFQARTENVTVDEVISQLIQSVPEPA